MSKITCKHYLPVNDSKRCSSYIRNGGCRHPDHLMCDEWLKANPSSSNLVISKQETRRAAAQRAQRDADLSNDSADYLPMKDEVESWKKMGIAVRLNIGNSQSLYVVPEYTEKDRNEISVEHACVLAMICRAFPDARVEEFYRKEEWE